MVVWNNTYKSGFYGWFFMSKIGSIRLSDGKVIFVEMDEVCDLPSAVTVSSNNRLPIGAQEVSAADKIKDSMQVLKDTLGIIADTVNSGIEKSKPNEWTIEVNFGFKGKTSPIPVLVSGESNVGIKLTATWKKNIEKEQLL